jgi:hypothetical protein
MFCSVIQSADSSLRAWRRCSCFSRYSFKYASRTRCIAARYLLWLSWGLVVESS